MKRSREPEEDLDPSSTNQHDVAIVPVSKIVGIDMDHSHQSPVSELKCSLPGHAPGQTFASYIDYESHYNKAHTNRCLDCRKSFPSSHILDLHINEFHNALTELRKEKGEATFACFVETCDEKRKSPAERRAHLIEQHMYPSNYFFAVTKAGIDRRQSMLVERSRGKPQTTQRRGSRPRGQKTDKTGDSVTAHAEMTGDANEPNDVPMREPDEPGHREQEANQKLVADKASTEDDAVLMGEPERLVGGGTKTAIVDIEMEDLAGAMSSLKFVPRAIRFGSRQRAGFAPR